MSLVAQHLGGALYRAPLGQAPALASVIKLGWEWLMVTHKLAYHAMN